MLSFLMEPRRPPAFHPELPHSLFLDHADGVLLLKAPHRPLGNPFSLGCAWSVIPRNVQTCPESVCLDLAAAHASLVRSLPIGASFQTITSFFPATSAAGWEALRHGQDADPLVASQIAALRRGVPYQMPHSQGQLRLIETLVTLRLPVPALDMGVAVLLDSILDLPPSCRRSVPQTLQANVGLAWQELQDLRGIVDNILTMAGHKARRLDGTALGMAVAQGLDPLTAPSPVILPDLRLSEQVLRQRCALFAGGYEVGPREHPFTAMVLSLQRAPDATYPGILCAPRAPDGTDHPMALWQAYPGPFAIVTNIAIVDPGAEAARASRKRNLAQLYAQYSRRSKDTVEALDAVLKSMFHTGSQLIWGRVHLVLWGQHATLPATASRVITAARQFKLEFGVEEDIGNDVFLQTLPLGFDQAWPPEDWLLRARRVETVHLVNMMGLYGAFRGTATPSILLLNERGEVVNLDFFDNPTNRHGLLLATTGGGKSFAVLHFLHHMMQRGASGIVLDRLASYQEACEYHQGAYHELDFDHPICINLFYGSFTPAHRAHVGAILAEMEGGGQEKLTVEERGVQAMAIAYFGRTFDQTTRGEPILQHFLEEVLEDGCFAKDDGEARRIGKTLARRLRMYVDGPYAGFVNGPNQLRLHERLTVLEFSKLENAKDLVGVLFFNIMYLLGHYYRDPRRVFLPKFCVSEECWDALQYEETAYRLQVAVRTYRKLMTSMLFVSNVPGDFDTPVGRVIKGLVAHKIFLQQASSELEDVQRIFGLTDHEARLVGSLRKHAEFGSLFLQFENDGGIAHLVPDAYARWLSSQLDKEKALREATRATLGGDLRAAVAALAAQYPSGLGDARHG